MATQTHWLELYVICRPKDGLDGDCTPSDFADSEVELDAMRSLRKHKAILLDMTDWDWNFSQGRHVYFCHAIVESEDPLEAVAALQEADILVDDALEIETYRVTFHENAIIDPLNPSEEQRCEAYKRWVAETGLDDANDPGAAIKDIDGIEFERHDGLRGWILTWQECADAGFSYTKEDSVAYGLDANFRPVNWAVLTL